MFAPETMGAVVRIAATGNLSSAVLTDEILLFFDKVFPLHPVQNQPSVFTAYLSYLAYPDR